ncbi:MAG: C40 family peptidase [Bacteroidota bacterium]
MSYFVLNKKNINYFLLVLASVFLFSCKSSKHASKTDKNSNSSSSSNTKKPDTNTFKKTNKDEKVDAILKEAFTYMGAPYKYGACSKDGTDCSGLVMNSFKKVGIDLPRSSKEQGAFAKPISVDDAKKGDLLFFCTKSTNCKEINHVAIVSKLEGGTVYFIHATVQKGVMVNNLNENYYKKAFIKAGRVIN